MNDEEASILFLIRLDADISDTIASFGAVFEEAITWINFETNKVKDLNRNEKQKFWTKRKVLSHTKAHEGLQEFF